MFKASGVSAPACAAPGKPPASRPTLKHKFGPLPYRALISNARAGNGVPAAGGPGGVAGGGAGEGVVEGDTGVAGAAAYREDSFAMTQTNQGYTCDWVSCGGITEVCRGYGEGGVGGGNAMLPHVQPVVVWLSIPQES